jgi:hypothetical protein
MVLLDVVGLHWPGATAWHAVFADVEVATPQQIMPGPEQSMAARHPNPAQPSSVVKLRGGHDWLCAMHIVFIWVEMQHVWVFKLHVALPHCSGPPS